MKKITQITTILGLILGVGLLNPHQGFSGPKNANLASNLMVENIKQDLAIELIELFRHELNTYIFSFEIYGNAVDQYLRQAEGNIPLIRATLEETVDEEEIVALEAALAQLEQISQIRPSLLETVTKLVNKYNQFDWLLAGSAGNPKRQQRVVIQFYEIKNKIARETRDILISLEKIVPDRAKEVFYQLKGHVDKIEGFPERVVSLKLTKDGKPYLKFKEEISNDVEVNDIVYLAVRDANPNEGISFHFNTDESIPNIQSDEKGLRHLFGNIIKNAAQVLVDKGNIYIKTSVTPDDDFVEVTIRDDGPGIPEDILPYIFDLRFTTKEEVGGTGFGLAFVKAVVDQLEGSITVKSKPGETVFKVRIPFTHTNGKPKLSPEIFKSA